MCAQDSADDVSGEKQVADDMSQFLQEFFEGEPALCNNIGPTACSAVHSVQDTFCIRGLLSSIHGRVGVGVLTVVWRVCVVLQLAPSWPTGTSTSLESPMP